MFEYTEIGTAPGTIDQIRYIDRFSTMTNFLVISILYRTYVILFTTAPDKSQAFTTTANKHNNKYIV